MEVKSIPAKEVQSVTLSVDFYADLVMKARTLELLERAMLMHITDDYGNKPVITSGFTSAIEAILPDTYEKMQQAIVERVQNA